MGAFQSSAFQGSAFQSNASVKANAVIRRLDRTATFTADAILSNATIVSGSFTANATLKRTQTGTLTANAVLRRTQTGSFTANAFLRKLIWDDTFTRTVAQGLGLRYKDSESFVPSEHKASVDGSNAVIVGDDPDFGYTSSTGYARPRSGYIEFDFLTPSDTTASEDFFIAVDAANPVDGVSEPTEIEVYHSGTGGVWVVDIYPSDAGRTFSAQPNTWYRVKAYFEGTSGGGGDDAIKIWQRDNVPEPHVWTVDGTHGSNAGFNQFWRSSLWLIPYGDGLAEDLRFDNLRLYATTTAAWEFPDYFTADAIIGTPFHSLYADAIISRTRTGSLTADAVLSAMGFTASALIKRIAGGTITANARIVGTVARSFTANAVIGWAGRLTADAVLAAAGATAATGSFTANAWIYVPRADPTGPGVPPGPGSPGDPGYTPGETPLVSIVVGGVDITAYTILSDAQFTMLVNGAIGTCHLRVRDDAHTRNFTSGAEITLDIDGRRKFGGFLLQPKRLLAFPVEDTTDPDKPSRFIVLDGVDYNILMSKRVVYNKASPNRVELRRWPADSPADEVIRYTFDHYTDLAADGVTYNGVVYDASPNPDKPGVIASGGLRFVDAMREINRLISGVFYIDAYKDLAFVDVDSPDAEWGLSDNPGVGQKGYRELTQTESGVNLVNDAMVWGAGQGSRRIVFARSRDVASIGAHGLWQRGEFTTQMYRQASVNERASTMVYGTDQSKRGGKDDQESWGVVTFESSFEAGQKVAIESEVFDKTEVAPIRRLTITFPSKKKPKLEMFISHEIDEPWNIFEFPPFNIGKFPGFDFNPIDIGPFPDFPGPSGCDGICGVTDTFDRTVVNSWGTSDSGHVWDTTLAAAEVDGDRGRIVLSGSAGTAILNVSVPILDVTVSTQISATGSGRTAFMAISPVASPGLDFVEADIDSGGQLSLYDGYHSVDVALPWGAATETTLRLVIEPGVAYLYAWEAGGTQPGTPTLTLTETSFDYATVMPYLLLGGFGGTFGVYFDDLSIDGVDLCTGNQFDNFNDPATGTRAGSGSWGTSPTGSYWNSIGPGGSTLKAVEGGYGKFEQGSGFVGGQTQIVTYDRPDIWDADAYTMTTRFKIASYTASTETQQGFIWRGPDGDARGWGLDKGIGGGGDRLELFSPSGSTFIAASWIVGLHYNVKYEIDGNTHRVKHWQDGAAEPAGWSIEQTGFARLVSTDFAIFHARDSDLGHTWGIWYDFIEFDYDGRPCYQTCAGIDMVIDSFSRSVTGSFGTASSGGTWSKVATLGTTDEDVDGNRGTSDNPGSGSAVSVHTLAMPDVFAGKTWVEFRVNLDTTVKNQLVGFYNAAGSLGIEFLLNSLTNRVDYGRFQSGTHTYITSGPTYPADGTSFWVALRLAAGNVFAKYWLDSDPEPDAWLTTPQTGASAVIDDLAIVRYQNGQSTPAGTMALDHISVKLPDTCEGTTGSGTATPSSGANRDDQTGNGGATIFTVPTGYEPGTTRVFVDGLLQRRGFEYEETDYEAGVITFTTAPEFGSTVSIFYEVLPV